MKIENIKKIVSKLLLLHLINYTLTCKDSFGVVALYQANNFKIYKCPLVQSIPLCEKLPNKLS